MNAAAALRATTRGMRMMLWLGVLLTFLAGIQLYFFPEDTDHFFAWTIDPPMTASFLGAFYWTSVVLASLSALQRHWVNARVGLLGVQVFVWLTLGATLLHLDKFHLDVSDDFARGAAWLWLVVYAAVPPLLTFFYVDQIRSPGMDARRAHPTPALFRAIVSAHAAVAIVFGLLFYAAPDRTASLWPWELTPLTARAVAAWLLGLGLVQVSAVLENDWSRLRPALGSYLILGVLQLIAVFRFRAALDTGPKVWIYLALFASVAVVGLYGMIVSLREARTQALATGT
jgi:hypothetical protein